jgi:uncharacterized protein with FMN-binding domain
MTQPTQKNAPHVVFLFIMACSALAFAGCASPNDIQPTASDQPAVTSPAPTDDTTNPTSADKETTNPAANPTPSPTPAPTPSPKPSAANYKDGTYNATGKYNSPAGPETIEVTVTLKGDVVTDATVVSDATNTKSKFMQGMFIDNFKPQVIGKKIQDIHLTKVSGSSLTPIGFNDALTKIETKAS